MSENSRSCKCPATDARTCFLVRRGERPGRNPRCTCSCHEAPRDVDGRLDANLVAAVIDDKLLPHERDQVRASLTRDDVDELNALIGDEDDEPGFLKLDVDLEPIVWRCPACDHAHTKIPLRIKGQPGLGLIKREDLDTPGGEIPVERVCASCGEADPEQITLHKTARSSLTFDVELHPRPAHNRATCTKIYCALCEAGFDV